MHTKVRSLSLLLLVVTAGFLSGAFSRTAVPANCRFALTIRDHTGGASLKERLAGFFKRGQIKKTSRKSSPEKPVEKRYRIPAGLTGFFSKIGDELVRTADRFRTGVLLQKYGRKLLFLGICGIVIIAAVSFYRSRYESRRFLTTTRLSIMDKEVQRACRYIEDNYRDPGLSMSSISRVLVTGEAFLEALFEKELGLTLDGFINQVRINRVKIQLRQSPGDDEQALALAAGYHDGTAMAAAFESICGCDIASYRRALSECDKG